MIAKAPRIRSRSARLPMARAARLPLFEREVRERLSPTALDLLFAQAEVLAEGSRGKGPTSGRSFFGSVMITFDLERTAPLLREQPSAATAERLAAMLAGDARALGRLRRLASADAARLAGGPVTVHPADVRVRAEEARVLVDIDVEAGS